MGWKSYLYPQTVARFSTPFNRDIRVVEVGGRPKLLVNGSPQSGPYIASLWSRVFRAFHIARDPSVRTILVFGVGGGTVIEILSTMYPRAHITAVDIDEKMVDIGKKYFSLNTLTNVSFIVSDAKDYSVKLARLGKHFDLIIVDLFVGRIIPKFVSDKTFLEDLKQLCTSDAKLVMNFLQEYEYRELSNVLLDKLQKIFLSVKDTRIFLNRFFVCLP